MTKPKKGERQRSTKLKKYLVTCDVFFMETVAVEAKNEKEAFIKAQQQINYGMGEQITLYEVVED